MKREVLFLSAYIALLSFAFVGTTIAADSKLEKAVRDADAEWSKVAAAKDLDKTVAFYADDAVVLPPNQPAVTNKDGIRNLWKGFLDSFIDISWKTARVEVAKSGDMAVLTGTENARLLGVLSGQTRREADEQVDAVRRLSKLGEHFDRPVLSYSQGMRARLGFAVAHQIHPDILLLDEVHEALDHEFREIVRHRAEEIIAAGGIVVAAGHDHPLLAQICTRAVFLSGGVVQTVGPFEEVQRTYLDQVA